MADQKASENWQRFMEMKSRGHYEYTIKCRRNMGFYFGDGGQWDADVVERLNAKGLPAFEYNSIKAAVDAAVGYQIHNRADVSFRPKGGEADTQKATTLSKLVMDIFGRNDYHHLETDMFRDGLTQARGYLDIRMSYDNNVKGEIEMKLLDPMDVLPDPDAKSYDPDDWGDVIITRWMTGDEIEGYYGKKARNAVEEMNPHGDADFGVGDFEAHRSKFGNDAGGGYMLGFSVGEATIKRFRVLDRQKKVVKRQRCIIMDAGDFRPVDELSEEKLAELTRLGGSIRIMSVEKIRWTVTTRDITLFDEWSPLSHFSVVMFSPFFMRGKTMGMVENAIGPQMSLNKAMSQAIHVVGQTANSGYTVEEGSLINMDVHELEERGSENGIVIEHKAGMNPPRKIQPNPWPSGLESLIARCLTAIREVTVPEAMTGIQGSEISGVAIQSRQFAAQQQLATPLDNLTRTRRIIARNVLDYVQRYYSGERIIRISQIDPYTGQNIDSQVKINSFDPITGGIMNDITVGEYQVEITENPAQITFDNSQFTQIMELRKNGIQIPDAAAIRHSNLADKYDILREMQSQAAPAADPTLEAKANLLNAQAEKVAAEMAEIGATTVYTLTQAAMGLSTNVHLVPAIDSLGASVGFKDKNGGGIVDGPIQGIDSMQGSIQGGAHTNPMSPMRPFSPVVGHQQGIETLENNQ